MTDIKSLLREAAIVVRCYADREYADIELANQLEAAAESMHTTGTGVDSDQDTVQFTAYLEDLLEQERDKLAAAEEELTRFRNGYKVRVLREALDTIAESDPDESSGSLRDIANRALAITAPERCEI